jgi:hypothetical protein
MSVFWLQPQAWWGLAALAIPVAIHLLARHKSRRLPFPSLRFLQTTRLAALRRRVISDWPLLMVRSLLLAVIVAALAAPVVVSEARRAAWNRRVARAIIVAQNLDPAADLVTDETRGSFASAVFSPPTIADGLRSAQIWLARQPPAAREVVIVGDLREGAVQRADLAALDPQVGIRFLPVPGADAQTTGTVRVVSDAGDGIVSAYDLHVSANDRHTMARFARATDAATPAIAVQASASEQPHADAILRAVLREGVIYRHDTNRAVTILFAGATEVGAPVVPTSSWAREVLEQLPGVTGGELDGRLVVVAPMAATDIQAAALVSDVAKRVFAVPFDVLEPRRIGPSSLAAWSRAPGPSPDTALPADEGDRRVLWSAALILLGVEQLIRRSRRPATTAIADDIQEPRVA